jgi:hypothetical protein
MHLSYKKKEPSSFIEKLFSPTEEVFFYKRGVVHVLVKAMHHIFDLEKQGWEAKIMMTLSDFCQRIVHGFRY